MNVKAGFTIPKPKQAVGNKANPEMKVARLTSRTTIRVTRAQVTGTIIVGLLTMLSVVVGNLDKFKTTTSNRPFNAFVLENRAERVHEFMENNLRDVDVAHTSLLARQTLPRSQKEKIVRVLEGYKVESHENIQEFIEEKARLGQALQSGNSEGVEATRQRLNQIAIRDASNLEDAQRKLDSLLLETRQKIEELGIERLSSRKPVKELIPFLPIKRETTPEIADLQVDLGGAPSKLDAPKCARPLTCFADVVNGSELFNLPKPKATDGPKNTVRIELKFVF